MGARISLKDKLKSASFSPLSLFASSLDWPREGKMALSFTRFSWLWFGGKEVDQVFIKSVNEWGASGSRGEPESLKLNSIKGVNKQTHSSRSNRKVKKKWKNREERNKRIDKEYDVVIVPSDGVCLSESESDSSDWSIGWLEPHGSEFQTDEDSFAVLVPCYKYNSDVVIRENDVKNHNPAGYSDEANYIQQWLSSLQKSENTTFL